MKRFVPFLLAFALLVVSPNGALAAWSPASSGSGTSSAISVGLPTSVAAAATSSSSVHVTWSAPTGTSASPSQYVVRRTAPTTATVCTVTSATFACDDTGLSGSTTYTYTVEALVGTNWSSGQTSGITATTSGTPTFIVAVAGGSKTAGTAFAPTLTATTNGATTDTAYTGVKTITFSGPSASPSGTSPTYPATVTFTAGVGTPNITLYAAATATLAATDGTRSGSTSVTVVAGTATQLRYTSESTSCSSGSVIVGNGGSYTAKATVYDAYLNPVAQASALTVNLTRAPVIGTLSPTNLTVSIGSSQTSASFTYTLPNGNPAPVTVTAAAAGLTSAACIVKKT